MADFTFIVDGSGNVSKEPPSPWHVGPPGSTIFVALDNRDGSDHRIDLVRIKHRNTGAPRDGLLAGRRVLRARAGEQDRTRLRVVDVGLTGVFVYDAILDDLHEVDPEIIVDEPPFAGGGPKRGGKGKGRAKTGGKKAAAAKRAAKKSAATKKKAGKKRSAKRTAKKAAAPARRAKRSAAKRAAKKAK